MKQEISFYDFCDAFGESRKNQFTYDGKRALFDYLENLEEETEQEFDLDIIALCCEYTEYKNVADYLANYTPSGVDTEPEEDEDAEETAERVEKELLSYLEDHTSVIYLDEELNDGFIIQDY